MKIVISMGISCAILGAMALSPTFAQSETVAKKQAQTAPALPQNHPIATDFFHMSLSTSSKDRAYEAASNIRRRHKLPQTAETDSTLTELYQTISRMPSYSLSRADHIDLGILAESQAVSGSVRGQTLIGCAGTAQ
ncbi:MAG: hypothetical protein K2X27_03695 [Candidatus Obscuribacterales bacterium]|nr:hypothetical protein [Candidatus Obscuribacterales bacterium]